MLDQTSAMLHDLFRVQDFWSGVSGLGFKVSGFGFGVWGLGFRIWGFKVQLTWNRVHVSGLWRLSTIIFDQDQQNPAVGTGLPWDPRGVLCLVCEVSL